MNVFFIILKLHDASFFYNGIIKLMIGESFFNNPLNKKIIEDAIIQLSYDITYHSAFQTKKSLLKEKKEQFILVSIHKWLKDNNATNITVKFIGNLKNLHHYNDFEFHITDLDSKTVYTKKFTFDSKITQPK